MTFATFIRVVLGPLNRHQRTSINRSKSVCLAACMEETAGCGVVRMSLGGKKAT